MTTKITDVRVLDVRFPTSRMLDGSDAMNPDPDYSAAYVVIETDAGDGLAGHGFAFTIGRGNEVQVAAIEALRPFLVGTPLSTAVDDLGEFARRLVYDSQLRWLGPEKGIVHMAIGAVVNALWDLRAKRAGKPVWLTLADLTTDEIVDLVDFRYLSDVLSPARVAELLDAVRPGRGSREKVLRAVGYPAYTTSPGWLGYSDEKMVRLAREAVDDGFEMIKLKVGADLEDDVRRLAAVRDAVGPGVRVAIDANQRWDVPAAIRWLSELAPYDPWWIEEPTSPDDVLGHAAVRKAVSPIQVATGEHVHNRVMFKQLLQAGAIDVLQLDAARVGGVNENVAILLLAAHFGIPVCPHAGGVGLCELVQHLAMFDLLAVSGSWVGRAAEYVDHLHEHFVTPARVDRGRYQAPLVPGFSAELLPRALQVYAYPHGSAWTGDPDRPGAPSRRGGTP